MSPWTIGEPLGAALVILLGGMAPLLALPAATLLLGENGARALRPAIQIVESLALALETFARWCLLVLALGMLVTVALRYLFGDSFTRLNEAVMYAHALCFLMAAPAALMRDAHVRVDVVYTGLSPRGKAIVDLAGYHVFLVPVMVLLLIYCGPIVELAWKIGEKSAETDGLPFVFLLKTAMPIFAVAMLAQGCAFAGRAALLVRGLEPAAPPANRLPLQEGVG
jgi:TRAP-type mannitol/chloroaromatic compound transport system permease small subunit